MKKKFKYGRFLEGRRIYLREVRTSDVDGSYISWMNDPEIMKYLESRFYPHSRESLVDFVIGKMGDTQNVFLAIILKRDDRHIGNIKLGPINWIHRLAEIGIIIGEKDCWGKGFASEAIRLISEYAFNILNLRKLTASIYEENKGSIKAFQNAGFSIEAVRKQHVFFKGRHMDTLLLGRLKHE